MNGKNDPARKRARYLLKAGMTVFLSLALLLVVAEIALRFLPVATGAEVPEISEAQPLLHLGTGREITYSVGAAMRGATRRKVNNLGFVNDQDYVVAKTKPLAAVIGDSFVEALMVAYDETMYGRLATAANDKARVYSFGTSGAPLSQYLAWAGYVSQTFHPDALVFAIVGNDFDESMAARAWKPGYRYVRGKDGVLSLRLTPYSPHFLRDIVAKSSVARYLLLNLKVLDVRALIQNVALQAATGNDGGPVFVGNTAAQFDETRLKDSKDVVDAFFRDLPDKSGLPPDRIGFLVDGLRKAIYPRPGTTAAEARQRAAMEASYFGVMRRYFIEVAGRHGYQVFDLDAVFREDYARVGRPFEAAYDSHWNSYGHEVVARTLATSSFWKRFLAAPN